MHFDEFGGGERLVVALHGMPQAPEALHDMLRDVRDARILVAHLPGYGQTPANGGDFDAVTEALVERIGSEPVVLLGVSGGAYRALALALAERVEVCGLVLIAPAVGPTSEEEREAFRSFGPLLRSGADLDPVLTARWLTEEEAKSPLARSVLDWGAATSRENLALECEAYAELPCLLEQLASITLPVTLMVGRHDAATPLALIRSMAAKLPLNTLHVVPDAGHAITTFHPYLVSRWAEVAIDVAFDTTCPE